MGYMIMKELARRYECQTKVTVALRSQILGAQARRCRSKMLYIHVNASYYSYAEQLQDRFQGNKPILCNIISKSKPSA